VSHNDGVVAGGAGKAATVTNLLRTCQHTYAT
jgi:hypothetical protein